MNHSVQSLRPSDHREIEPELSPVKHELHRHLRYTLACDSKVANSRYLYRALALVARDRLVDYWCQTQQTAADSKGKHVYYLSLEYLIGRALGNAIANLDLDSEARRALEQHCVTLEEVADEEIDAGLGNGGLGRLAACFLDSCATLQLPVMGYGIRYEYGMFHQHIENGRQIEDPDHWLRDGNPWEIERSEDACRVKFYGRSELYFDNEGVHHCRWIDTHDVLAVPFDMPIPGYQNRTVNTLRLWKASATDVFDLSEFNAGVYTEAVAAQNKAEQITMVLYPNDASENGKELRLKQQYFLVSASLQDVLRKWKARNADFSEFGGLNCFQLNDTHPACAIAELMRLLMDENGLGWEEAWQITTRCMAYTNHTLLPEALERWSVGLFGRLLPRLLEIIYEINRRFLKLVSERKPDDPNLLKRVSIIEEGDQPHVRMAYLSIVGSFSINGVAHLHTELLKNGLFADFYAIWPEKFNNKTNGVTQRRWLATCNPGLRRLLNETIGQGFETDMGRMEQLIPYAEDAGFRAAWREVKQNNKRALAAYVQRHAGYEINEDSLFDVQVKRIHEYKRQLLNILHVIHLYDKLTHGEVVNHVPRTVLIGGKAAPGYHVAKQIVKLAHDVARVINNDTTVGDRLKLVFIPNYRVSAMEVICPGTELSEQISTAGKEASGTGNMKFMMNGALTIGTLDGANIEMREHVGAENFFLFGLDAQGVVETKKNYNPNAIIAADKDIRRIMEMLESGQFNRHEPGIFDVLISSLRSPHDPWLTIADMRSYLDAQSLASHTYLDVDHWNRMSILNSAHSGWFSSDRTIQQYASEIWRVAKS